ncbi:MAG: type II toxin-antitoxin system HicA family toxin [Calditrichaeota bacterium]|nr:type II toxin-antitoxin system HicA family toxin [Calditrichota bacterium]
MTQIQRLIERIRNNPRSVRFNDLMRILENLGYSHHKQRGSHIAFKHPTGLALTIVRPHGREAFCNQYDVRKVLRLLSHENN